MDLHRALNDQAKGQATAYGAPVALCAELSAGQVPEWVHLLPLGPDVVGADGRAWKLADPDALVANSPTSRMVIDFEHATDVRAPNGEEAPAAGWVRELQVVPEGSAERAPGIWARVDWTERGANAVRSQEYRFQSPVFLFDRVSKAITKLERAGLTNRPNLDLKALNRAGEPGEGDGMKPELLTALCAMLGLAKDGATEDTILTAVNSRHASSVEMVPRADLETALNRAKSAETALAEREKADHEREVELALNQATEAGKVSPASRDHYRAICASPEGLKSFLALCATLLSLVSAEQTAGKVAQDATATAQGTGLSAEQKAHCAEYGISEENYLRALNEEG